MEEIRGVKVEWKENNNMHSLWSLELTRLLRRFLLAIKTTFTKQNYLKLSYNNKNKTKQKQKNNNKKNKKQQQENPKQFRQACS